MFDYEELTNALISGKAPIVKELTERALAEGESPQDVLTKGLVAGMNVVGQRFKNNEFYVPEVLIAARAMKNGMEVLRPKLVETGVQPVATVAIGTVRGDLHDIEGAGFDIMDLGVDVKPEQFVEAVKSGAGLVCLSALLTTTMPAMGETINALKDAGARGNCRIMIGGAPVTQNYADEIGADGYAPDAASAVDAAKALLSIN